MGICGSAGRKPDQDEVWQRGSISTKSLSASNVLQDEIEEFNNKVGDQPPEQEQQTFDEQMEEQAEEELRQKAMSQRKRLTLHGDLVGKAQTQSLADLQAQLK